MTESTKTITTCAVAGALLLLAFLVRPRQAYVEPEGEVGQSVFSEWKDPTAAKRMEISTLDETTQMPRHFEVALVDGKWSIPSHGNFPANAEDKVVKAAGELINLKILGVVSDAPGTHETYGVVEPDPAKLSGLAAGVGKLVVVKDVAGKDLARLIIGKEDKSPSGSEAAKLRFVRRAGQDRVYRAAMQGDLFSAKFQDWIDTDLLGLKQPWDVTTMQIRDYTLEDRGVARKGDLALEFSEPKNTWTVKKLTEYKDDKPVESKLAAGEELDSMKLDDLKRNLSGLKFLNVSRKPAELADKLKKNKDFAGDRPALESLAAHDFYATKVGNSTDLVSSGGDVTIGMKDGVEYVVHFGKDFFTSREEDEAKPATGKAAKDSKFTDHVRYVFVTAKFNEDLLAKPKLEPLPEAKKPDAAKPGDKKPEENKPEAKKPDDKQPETKAPEAKSPDNKKAENAKPAETKPAANQPDAKVPVETKPAAKKSAARSRPDLILALADQAADAPADAKQAADKKANDKSAKSDAKQTDAAGDKEADAGKAEPAKNEVPAGANKAQTPKPATDTKPAGNATKPTADATKPAGDAKPEPGKTPPSDIKRADEEKALDAERKRVDDENKRKTADYEKAVTAGKEHAKQLNDRFADWYYMISEDDYKKVHLTKVDLIKKSLAPGPADPFQKRNLDEK